MRTSNSYVFDFKSDAEEAIMRHFVDRAEAKGEPKKSVRRAFFGISSSGSTSYYVYKAGHEAAYLVQDSFAHRDRCTVYFSRRPPFFPKTREGNWARLDG